MELSRLKITVMKSILHKAKQHCISLLEQSRCAEMPYHNLQHTREVYCNVQLIGAFEGLEESDFEIVELAALFHDTGLSEAYLGHEAVSAENAILFLETYEYSKLKMDQVISCIKATQLPQKPQSILEKVICDADLFHLSSETYFQKNAHLRKEWDVFLNKVYSDREWHELTVDFLKNHKFHTVFGKTILEEGQSKNNSLLNSKLV